jgi:hypothetical protein
MDFMRGTESRSWDVLAVALPISEQAPVPVAGKCEGRRAWR